MSALPKTWEHVPIGELVEVNPRKNVKLNGDDLVSFVPMAAVDEVSGTIATPIDRPYKEVSKGFTHFRDADVIFAKITPSMENGKSAVANNLTNGTGMGSTEFHVFRTNGAILPEYLWHYVRQKGFRDDAKAVMSGAVGQQRVPADWLKKRLVPLAPLAEQDRIAAKVNWLTARTARARKELERVPTLIARYKERLLAQIFESPDSDYERIPLRELGSFVTSGSRGWAKYYANHGDLFLRVGNVQRTNIGLDLSEIQHVQPPSAVEGQRTRLQKNDLLITITADVGRVGVFADDRVAYINQHVALARLDDPRAARFIAWYLSSEPGQVQLRRNIRGATKAGLGLDDIRAVLIPHVAIEVQAEIVRRIESVFGWLDRLAADHAVSERLIPKLDAAILERAFCGKLVPQDPSDEPVSALLERSKAERAAAPMTSKACKSRKLAPPKETITVAKNLQEALAEARGWISAQDAFQRCGIGPGASTEEIEILYAELRQLDKDGKLDKEVVNDKQGRKLHDRLRLKAA
jgi:type I restriction enzyme, S subunit